jgi:serine/threonine protein kinase
MSSINDVVGGRYRLEQLLGRGGMSDVYRAFDLVEGRDVALKVVRSGDAEYVRRLSLEVRALESFRHPGLIRLIDAGGDGDETYLVMEYVDGVTLSELLRSGPLDPAEVARVGASLADSLAYVHERGVVHRDVKPSNIMRANDQSVWLGDFGIAQIHDATSYTVVGTAMGTVVYMAPEQLHGREVGPRADVWSLGLVLLECLTGERAFVGSPSEVMARRLSGPVELPGDLPTPWRIVLTGMLDEVPERRLSGHQVAALLVSSAFAEAWLRQDSDATAVVAPLSDQRTTRVSTSKLTSDETIAMAMALRTPSSPGTSWWSGRNWKMLVGFALCVALVVWLVTLATSPSSAPPTTTSSTTTTVLTSTQALADFLADVASDQAAGSLSSASAQTLSQFANQALSDATAGSAFQAQNDLQQAASFVANELQGGLISSLQAATLQRGLVILAHSLHLTAPSATATTTTTTFSPGPPSGGGPGQGKGNGNKH